MEASKVKDSSINKSPNLIDDIQTMRDEYLQSVKYIKIKADNFSSAFIIRSNANDSENPINLIFLYPIICY
jgi:hypothetical protein